MNDASREPACRVCGCTWNNACEGGCWWADRPGENDAGPLCSTCEHFPEASARQLVADELGLAPEAIVQTASLREDLGMDSLDGIMLAMRLEDELGASELDDETLAACATYGDLCAAVRDAMPEAVIDAP